MGGYSNFSIEELIERIEEIERLNMELLKEKNQETKLEYAWTGNLGHWYWDIQTNAVTFNPLKITTLGYEMNELPEHITYQFFTEKLHKDDLEPTMKAMRDHLYGKSEVYESEYRIKAKNGKYKWYYDRGKITQRDEKGKPVFLAGIVFDITEKKETQMELEKKNKILSEMSNIDGLTKINNHRALIEILSSEMVESQRSEKPLSVTIFDIDNFKKVNDSNGHVFGDYILVEIAKIIKKGIRNNDIAGRYGGEEFMVIFTDTDSEKAKKVSDRIRENIEKYEFDKGQKITISGGVKQYQGETVAELIENADTNLYKAKENGKNQVI